MQSRKKHNHNDDISYEKIKELRTAVKCVETLLEIYRKDKNALNEEIYVTEFVSAVQEIIYVNRNSERFKNSFYGNKYTNKTLISALKEKDKADAVMINAWIKKFENRMATNYGVQNLVKKKRDIEVLMYKIKSKIFLYQNFDDMVFLNDQIFYFVARSVISRKLANNVGRQFEDEIIYRLDNKYKSIKFCIKEKVQIPKIGHNYMTSKGFEVQPKNIFDLFREFILYPLAYEISIIELSEMINKYFNKSWDKKESRCIQYMHNSCGATSDMSYVLWLLIDSQEKNIYFLNYVKVESDYVVKRALNLEIDYFFRM